MTPTTEPTLPPPHPEERFGTITSSLGSQVDVKVNGFRDNSLRFDQLVQAINDAEHLLGVAYPSPVVTMTKVQDVEGGFCGEYEPTYVSPYVGDPEVIESSDVRIRADDECTETFSAIAHEAAHTWFHGSSPASWIDEGLANAMERQLVAAYDTDAPIYFPRTYCGNYTNLSQLERAAPPRVDNDGLVGFDCNYSLGDGIFDALQRHYGDAGFNSRIAQLARSVEVPVVRPKTIADIRSVFGTDSVPLGIIDDWYEGQPEMRKYRHLDAVDWTFPPTIDGNYLHFSGQDYPNAR